MPRFHSLLSVLPLLCFISGVSSTTFTVTNNCGQTVWPGVLSGAGTPPLATTGFALAPGESRALDVPSGWSGRLWARSLCSSDAATGRFTCATGDCGSGAVDCSGSGAAPPATLAEFTLNGSGDLDFFDVSLVDGFNLPVLVAPQGPSGGGGGGGSNCAPTGCLANLNTGCPPELRVMADGEAAACRSACEAFGTPEFCCIGAYGSPASCRPTAYSQLFKDACPRAYSYAYDDSTSTFTCSSAATAGYAVTFCPSAASLKSAGSANPQAAGLPLTNDTMSFLGEASLAPPTLSPTSSLPLCLLLFALLPLSLRLL